MEQLFCDCKTDEEKCNFFLSERAVETGVIAPAISNDVAMAYHRCSELKKERDTLRAKIAEMEKQEPIGTTEGMPGTTGFTMACFHADKVPIGSKLYALPGAQAQPAPIVPDATVLLRRAAMAMEVVGTDWRESDPTLRLDLASALAATAEIERQEPTREWWDCLIADISAVDCVHRGSPTYVHDAYWMRDRAVQILEKRRDSLPGAKGE